MLPIVAASSAAGVQIALPNPKLALRGFSIAESDGTASTAEVAIRHGNTSSDPLLCAPVNLVADGFGYLLFQDPIPCPNGIFIDRVSGSTTVVLYVDYI